MKIRTFIAGTLALILTGASLRAADTTKFYMKPGSKMRIEGTATAIHTHWAVESHLIGGYLEAGPDFPTEPGQAATPGKIQARAEPFIPVRSLKSVEDNGEHYSDAMDGVMYDHLKAKDDPRAMIYYHLTDLTLKEPAKSKDAPYTFEATGQVVVAGVTNVVTMPIQVLPLGNKQLKITGSIAVKMTDFKISPPAPVGILLKTGDEVKLIFQWMVGARPAATAATK